MERAKNPLPVLLVFVLLLAAACLGRFRTDVPAQGWWEGNGPVVPHDSFPADCSLCHVGDGWSEIRADFEFDHGAETGVVLEGAHVEAQCLRCHNDRGPVALFAARGCAGCHEDVHRGLLGGDCEVCHGPDDWRPEGVVAEHARTRFPLIGAHVAAACWRCHPGVQSGNFLPVSTQCATCHQEDLAQALDPDHLAQGWTTDCQDCHVPTTWSGAGFTHGFWPLNGAHKAASCEACHAGGSFVGTPTDCVDCHLSDYLGATDPDHDVLGFPTACDLCHGTAGWEGADFNHVGIVDGCVSCHLDDYQGTTDPDHAASGFSTSCEDCHGTGDWEGAFFDHTGITTGCADCHLDDYLGTSDPDHQSAGFPTDCETCHGTNGWDGATFNHTFKIFAGEHAGFSCAECHLTPGLYTVASCTHCHAHGLRDMADEHDDVRGYQWSSPACIACHPTGDE